MIQVKMLYNTQFHLSWSLSFEPDSRSDHGAKRTNVFSSSSSIGLA